MRIVPLPPGTTTRVVLSEEEDNNTGGGGNLDRDYGGELARAPSSSSLTLASSSGEKNSELFQMAFPRLSVRLAWIRNEFIKKCKGQKYTWTKKSFLKAEHGGGADDVVQVNVDNLKEHRNRINAAGKDGDGKPTTVMYSDIPFELMTTDDVCFGIVKPATEHVKTSYAEMLSNTTESGHVQDATVFVSHAWKYTSTTSRSCSTLKASTPTPSGCTARRLMVGVASSAMRIQTRS